MSSVFLKVSLSAMLSIASMAAASTAIEAVADASIREGSGISYNTTTNLPLAYGTGRKVSRKVYLKFDVSSVNLKDSANNAVSLKLTSLEDRRLGEGAALRLYGLNEGATAGGKNPTAENWDDTATGNYIVWSTEGHKAPANNPDATDKYNGMDPKQATLLGTFPLGKTPLTAGQTITLSNSALSDFVKASKTGVITLVLTVEGVEGQSVNLVAREHASLAGPTLEFGTSAAATCLSSGCTLVGRLDIAMPLYMTNKIFEVWTAKEES